MSASKPKIVVDARMINAQGHGISLYVQQLALGLSRLNLSYEPLYLVAPDCPRDSFLRKMAHVNCQIPFLHPSELWRLSPEIRRLGPALFHTPSFSSLWNYPCPHVQTVHDLNHLHFGDFAKKAYYRFILLRSLRGAQAVVSVSHNSALEIRSWLVDHGFDLEIQIVPNAIEDFPETNDSKILGGLGLEEKKFFFCLANSKPHKNLSLLIEAYAEARRQRSLPPLVLSVPGESKDGLIYTGSLDANSVGALLRQAKGFFFPSLYEGFGRPPLEAALAGTIPVVSSLSVHREALSGVTEAIFLDPKDRALWKESFLLVAESSARVSERSRSWVREAWSLERQAKAMDAVYRDCLGIS